MALRWCDSFDHYATADFAEKSYTVTNAPTITSAAARFGNGLRTAQGNNGGITKLLDAQATWIVGFAFMTDRVTTADQTIFGLLDAGTIQVDVRVQANTNKLIITRNGTQLGTASTTALAINTFYYIELKCTINNTTGVAVLRINGVTEINLSSQDTQNTANATADQIRLNGISGGSAQSYDDWYVCDGTGATNNDFLGDVRVEALFPNGAGATTQWTRGGTDSGANWSQVDEATPNDDTDYVQGSTVGDKDTYAHTNLTPTTGTVYGLMISMSAKKTDAGSRSIASVARLSATEVDGPNKALTSSYIYHSDVRETKPGGGAWAISDVNSAEFGPKVTV